MIKYLGSKRQLIPWILQTIDQHFPHAQSVLDLFSGTARVGFALKEKGFLVVSNDHNRYAYHIAHCYIETSLEDLPPDFDKIIDHLNQLPAKEGFFTENYCIKARFFHPKNGAKIDAIRQEIDQLDLNDKLRSVVLVSLMEAADRIDSTCGIQMAYLKEWAERAQQPLRLRCPKLAKQPLRGPGRALCLDAAEAAQAIACDIAYLDPPYNQHSYRSNYHIWETLMLSDSPSVYGRAHKRLDCKTIKSDFNSKVKFKTSLKNTLDHLKSQHIVLSFSDEGFISREEIEALLSAYGQVSTCSVDYKRYVGAQIGIYNPQGQKVGKVNKLRNQEFLYVVHRDI